MKTLFILSFVFALLCSANAAPSIPNLQQCGNGISCAPSQTCMTNATGAGAVVINFPLSCHYFYFLSPLLNAPHSPVLQYACSPLPNAVRCNDARFSCPSTTTCAQGCKCEAADGSLVNAVTNVDAFYDDPMRCPSRTFSRFKQWQDHQQSCHRRLRRS